MRRKKTTATAMCIPTDTARALGERFCADGKPAIRARSRICVRLLPPDSPLPFGAGPFGAPDGVVLDGGGGVIAVAYTRIGRSSACDNRIRNPTEQTVSAEHFNDDGVAGSQLLGAGGRPGGNQIAGLERDEL